MESNISGKTIEDLKQRGHEVLLTDPWSNGKVMAIHYDKKTGMIAGAVSARGNIGYAIGW